MSGYLFPLHSDNGLLCSLIKNLQDLFLHDYQCTYLFEDAVEWLGSHAV